MSSDLNSQALCFFLCAYQRSTLARTLSLALSHTLRILAITKDISVCLLLDI